MVALIVSVFFVAGISAAVLVIDGLSDMQASKLETARLRPEISAAIQNADPSQMTALCARHPESALGRVVKEVFARSDQLPANPAARSELFKMLLHQALAAETERANRGTNLLRTIGLAYAPLGLMATAWDMANAIASPGWQESNHPLPPYAMIASAFPYTIVGLLLSLTVLALYGYLKKRWSAGLSELDDSCSDLLCAFLSRPTGKSLQRTAGLNSAPAPVAEPGQGSPLLSRELA
jgi:biopolymer transport protein ExbB/TolQ